MPKLSIDIEARFAQATDAMNQLARQAESSAKRMDVAFKSLRSIGATIGVGELIRRVYEETSRLEKSQQQLAATLKATGFAAGITSKQLDEMAKAQAELSLFDDDDIRQAEVALLRFRNIQGKVFEQALVASLKLATAMGGSAVSGAEALGRALEDPVNGLKALRGFMTPLTEQQKELIRQFELTGNKAAAAQIVIDNLSKSLGENATGGLTGAVNRTGKAWQELLQTIGQSKAGGAVAVDFLDTISNTIKVLTEDLERLQRLEGLDKLKELARILETIATGHRQKREPLPDQLGDLKEGYDRFVAQQGAAAQRLEQLRETARLAAERDRKISAATSKAGFAAEMEAAKQSSDVIQRVLDDSYEKGLISTRIYYEARAKLAESAAQREVEAVDRLIKEQTIRPEDTTEERATKAAELVKLEAQRARLIQKAGADALQIDQERTANSQKYTDLQNETKARLLEGEGKLTEAAKLRFSIEARALLIAQKQGEGTDEQIVRLRERVKAESKFAEAVNATEHTLSELGRAERQIQNLRDQGAITTLDAIQRTDQARRDHLATLEQETAELEKQAALTRDPRLLEQAKEARQALDDLRAHSSEGARQMREIFENSMIDPFVDLVNHTKTADEALKGFFNNVAQSLLRLEAQNIAERIFGGRAGGGGVGLIGGFFGLFGGAGTKIGTVSANGNVMTEDGPLKLERYARGGIARRPMVSIFGEGRQPEAYVPLPDGRSIPVAIQGRQEGGRLMAGPSAVMERNMPTVTVRNELRVSPGAMHMTLRDWFEGEMSRQMATR